MFHYTEHLLLCPPWKRVKVFLGPFRLGKYGIFANHTWGHFFSFLFLSLTLWTSHELCWPSSSPKNSYMCWRFYCQTLQDCSLVFWLSGLFCKFERLRKKCKLEESMPVPCKYFHAVFLSLFGFMSFNLCSFHFRKKKWTDSIRSNISNLIQVMFCWLGLFLFDIYDSGSVFHVWKVRRICESPQCKLPKGLSMRAFMSFKMENRKKTSHFEMFKKKKLPSCAILDKSVKAFRGKYLSARVPNNSILSQKAASLHHC